MIKMDFLKKIVCEFIWKHRFLILIILIGLFLRSYQLHNWLDFGSDQVNDALRVSSVVTGQSSWPLLGPDMSNSGIGGRATRFHLGAMYYYFEILSAKMFGNQPYVLAYPDLLFTVFSIPLLYFFFRRYFEKNISLGLTGLYAISFYALSFSHSAWNVNSIPFFSILLLFGLLEFLVVKEKIHWIWLVSIAIAIGVGVQLHAILLVLFPAVTFVIATYLLWNDWRLWRKWLLIVLLVLLLNSGQILSEMKTGFANSKIFMTSLEQSSQGGEGSGFLSFLGDSLNCHIEANAYMATSIGSERCDYFLVKLFEGNTSSSFLEKTRDPVFILRIFAASLFSFFGYGAFFYFYRKEEKREKKYFLLLTGLYSLLSALVLLPVLEAPFRYFIHTFFIPLLFVGFFVKFLREKCPEAYKGATIIIFLFFIITNVASLQSVVSLLANKIRSGENALVLGEIEPMVDYMISQSDARKEAYISSDKSHANFLKSLQYVASQKGVLLERVSDKNIPQNDKPLFYITRNRSDDNKEFPLQDTPFKAYKNFNHIGVFVIQR